MVRLNRIYTRTGDDGTTGLTGGARRAKSDPRIEACGTVDETNACIGLARLHTGALPELDAMLARIQNDLFDLGADLSTPDEGGSPAVEPLRIVAAQVARLEGEIDRLNAALEPLAVLRLAWRQPCGGGAAPGTHGRPARREDHGQPVSPGRRAGRPRGPPLRQPAVGLPFRRRSRRQ